MRHISDKLATADRDEDDNDGEEGDVVVNDEDDNMRMRMWEKINIARNVCLRLQNKIKRCYFYCVLFTNNLIVKGLIKRSSTLR